MTDEGEWKTGRGAERKREGVLCRLSLRPARSVDQFAIIGCGPDTTSILYTFVYSPTKLLLLCAVRFNEDHTFFRPHNTHGNSCR